MANPIRQVGERERDLVEEAARQDEERLTREDDAFFRLTGINRRPVILDNPLADNNPSPDIANDGDQYIEDNPSEFINLPSQNSRRNNGLTQVQQSLLNGFQNLEHQRVGEQFNEIARDRVVSAYNRREKEKQEKEVQEAKEKRIEQSKNAIMELKIEED